MSSYGGLVFIGILVLGIIAFFCGLLGNDVEKSKRSNKKTLSKKQLVQSIVQKRDLEDEEEDYEMLWSEGGDMDDSF
jgi:hypothetical protein